jgi:hypothetical protein
MKLIPFSSEHDHESDSLLLRTVKVRKPYRKKINDTVTINYSLFQCHAYAFNGHVDSRIMGYYIDANSTNNQRVSGLMEIHESEIEAILA